MQFGVSVALLKKTITWLLFDFFIYGFSIHTNCMKKEILTL